MGHTFESVKKTPILSKTVEAEIEEAIRTRKLVPGTRLPSENELCDQFGVSRTVMREALRMLSARGLIRIEKGRGMFVDEVSAETVTAPMELYLQLNMGPDHGLDVVRARQLIEPPIAAEAARRHTESDAERLKRNVAELRAAGGDRDRLTELDITFHLLIAEASANPVVPLLVRPIHQLMPRIKASVYGAIGEAKEAAVEWHGKILDAILARDADRARATMEEHLEIAEQHVRRAQQSGGDGPA